MFSEMLRQLVQPAAFAQSVTCEPRGIPSARTEFATVDLKQPGLSERAVCDYHYVVKTAMLQQM